MKGIRATLGEFWNGTIDESVPTIFEKKQPLAHIVRSEFTKERPKKTTFERLILYHDQTPQIQVAISAYSELITGTEMVINTEDEGAKELLDEWIRKNNFYEKFESLTTTLLICGNAILEKLDAENIEDVVEVDMSSIMDKSRDQFGELEYYRQRQQAGQIVKLGEGQLDKFIEFNLGRYSRQPWANSLFHSLAIPRTVGNRVTAPLVEVLWGMEDAMAGIIQNNAYPITTITYPGANDVYLEKEAERWRRYKPGDKRVQMIKPEIEFWETQAQSKYTDYITHIEKAIELGTQFPHDIMTGDFTSRASSETTETIVMKKVRGFQRYLCTKLKRDLFEPILEQNGFNTEDVELEISFTTQNIVEMEPAQINKLYVDKVITLNEAREWYKKNTGVDLTDDDEIKQAELDRQAQFDQQNQNDFESLLKRIEKIHEEKKHKSLTKKLAERMDRKLELVKEAIADDKVELAKTRTKALESIISKIEEIG